MKAIYKDVTSDSALRIIELIEEKNISAHAVGVLLKYDFPNTFLQKLKAKSLKEDFLNEVAALFPDINPTWVLTGKGDKYLTDQNDYRIKVANGALAKTLGYGEGDTSYL